jgi:hypothetical protein
MRALSTAYDQTGGNQRWRLPSIFLLLSISLRCKGAQGAQTVDEY